MASPESALTVTVSPTAAAELAEIWQWNAVQYGPSRADDYLVFLTRAISDLNRRYAQGRPLSVRPDWRYILIRRRSKGHGHLAVYRFDDREINVLHVFHSAQDWQTKLAGEAT